MADVISSIGDSTIDGTEDPRHYSTLAAWEADGYRSAGTTDHAIAEIYYSDGNINVTAQTALDDNTPNQLTVRAASGEAHGGDPSTNAITATAGWGQAVLRIQLGTALNGPKVFEDIHIDVNGQNVATGIQISSSPGNYDNRVQRCLIHDLAALRNTVLCAGITTGNPDYNICSNLIFDLSNNNNQVSGIRSSNTSAQHRILGNTVVGITCNHASAAAYGISYLDSGNHYVRNNLVQDVDGNGTKVCFSVSSPVSANTSGNLSDDTSSPQTLLRSKTIAFNDKPGHDYSLAAGDTDAIDAADDLGVEANWYGSHIDITGRDRIAQSDTVDIGAFERVSGATPITLTLQDLTGSAELDAVASTQVHAPTLAEVTGDGHVVDAVALTQVHALAVAELSAIGEAVALALTQDHALGVEELLGVGELPDVAITIGGGVISLTLADLEGSASIDTLALTQVHALGVEESDATGEVDPLAATQVHALTVAELEATGELQTVSLAGAINLIVGELVAQGEIVGGAITQVHALATAEVLGEALVDGATITAVHALTVAELTGSAAVDVLIVEGEQGAPLLVVTMAAGPSATLGADFAVTLTDDIEVQ